MPESYNVLIMGASYGSLLGCKLLFGGHNVTLVCLPHEAGLISREGILTRLPVRSIGKTIEIRSRNLKGDLTAATPGEIDLSAFDLAALAMQEPQYRTDGARELLSAIGIAKLPTLSIMNMPPPPYLRRISGLDTDRLRHCYTDFDVWVDCDPHLMTLASPDPQAFRPPDEALNVLQVGLPTNFKAAVFESDRHTAIIRQMADDIETARLDVDGKAIELPVKLRVHDSIYVPMAKWPMLLAGNYRCIGDGSVRSIKSAVHDDIAASREIYEWVCQVCVNAGASIDDLVPFEKYANAAESLLKPSSAARALTGGARHIERVDRLVEAIASQQGLNFRSVSETVQRVDKWLETNRGKG